MSRPLTLDDIVDLRAYERERESFVRRVIEEKKDRRVGIGLFVSVVFENALTMRFQIQEMARAERMLEDEQIETELQIYNPLIPGRGELSMTLFVELTNEEDLREWLPKLVGIERAVVLRVGSGPDATVVTDEVDPEHAAQLTRDEVTASVHYVRIRLTEAVAARFLEEEVAIGINHPAYLYETVLTEKTKRSLATDWAN